MKRNQLCTTSSGGHISPLASIEPQIVSLIKTLGHIRNALNQSESIALINSIIKDTPSQQNLIKWKEKNSYSTNSIGEIGYGYWYSFKKRWADELESKKGKRFDLDRSNWTTYQNFSDMYDWIGEQLIESGVAKKINPIFMNKKG